MENATQQSAKEQPENAVPIFNEAANQWQQFAMMLLWKLKGQKKIMVSLKDVAQLRKAFAPGYPCIFLTMLPNGVEFQIVSEAEVGRRAAQHQQEMAELAEKQPQQPVEAPNEA